jgi:hypothetical protein
MVEDGADHRARRTSQRVDTGMKFELVQSCVVQGEGGSHRDRSA